MITCKYVFREADELKEKIIKFKNGTSMLQDLSIWTTQQQLQKVNFTKINIHSIFFYSSLFINHKNTFCYKQYDANESVIACTVVK